MYKRSDNTTKRNPRRNKSIKGVERREQEQYPEYKVSLLDMNWEELKKFIKKQKTKQNGKRRNKTNRSKTKRRS